MPVIFQYRIYRQDLRNNRRSYYIFGDNLQRMGLGGQAREMRGEPNAIGIATKYAPTNEHRAFFLDADFPSIRLIWDQEFVPVYRALDAGHIVVFPSTPLGSGLAALPKVAPRCYDYLQKLVASIAGAYPP